MGVPALLDLGVVTPFSLEERASLASSRSFVNRRCLVQSKMKTAIDRIATIPMKEPTHAHTIIIHSSIRSTPGLGLHEAFWTLSHRAKSMFPHRRTVVFVYYSKLHLKAAQGMHSSELSLWSYYLSPPPSARRHKRTSSQIFFP